MEGFLVVGQQHESLLPVVVPVATDAVHNDEALAQQALAVMFVEVDAAFARTARVLSPYEMHMAAFHLRLLKGELLKLEADGRSSADIIVMAATWLLARVSGLAPDLGRLLFSAAAAEAINRAGDTAVTWLENRAANYETEGQPVNLVQLRQGLAHFSENELRELCAEMGLAFDQLYGRSRSEKAWEMVACAVRYGCVLELAVRCLERRPYTPEN